MTGGPGGEQPKPVRWDERVTSFLKSGIGILTAVATVVVAVGGIVTAVSQLGGSGSAQPAAAPSPPTASGAATTVIVESDAQHELRSHVPSAIWPTCETPRDPEPTAVAAFNCRYREIVGLQYNLFASSQELESDYRTVKRRFGLAAAPKGASCDRGQFEGVYRVGGREVGHLLCFVDKQGHVASIVWTDGRLDIMAFAWRDDLKLAPLFETWQKGVGPSA
jgi:hypothetical protein